MRILTLLILAIFALSRSFAADSAPGRQDGASSTKPSSTLLLAAPRGLFEKFTHLMRKIYPDPRLEMQMAFTLMPLGYPSFNGVSRSKPMAICEFDTSSGPAYTIAISASPESEVSRFAHSLNPPAERTGEYLLLQFPPNGDAKINAGRAKSAIKALSKNTDFIKIFASEQKLNDILEYLNFNPEVKEFSRHIKSIALTLSPQSDFITLNIALNLKAESSILPLLSRANFQSGNEELRYINPDAAFIAFSSFCTPGEPVACALGAYPAKSALRNLANKCNSSFAASFFFDGEKYTYVIISKSKAAFGELLKLLSEKPPCGLGANAKITHTSHSEGKFTYIASKPNLPDIEPTYTAIFGGFKIEGNNLQEFLRVLKKIDSHDAPDSEFALKKYFDQSSELTFVLNNNALFTSILGRMGYSLTNELQHAVLRVKFSASRIDISTNVHYQTLRAFADLLRHSTEREQEK